MTAIAFSLAASIGCARRSAPPVERVADPTSARALANGKVVGFVGDYGSHVWLGIPYAEPPVGPLRWRAPRPAAAWNGARSALVPPPMCPQFPSAFGEESSDRNTPIGQEDCLYLNVWAPRFAAGEVPTGAGRVPVLFWIHGGGNVIGHAAFYDGGNLAATHGVIIVALNYRLGPFGWMRQAALRGSAADDADRSGNYGTLDVIRGLEWVRDNVAAFGGDPGNVTIFGESAGGRNVFMMLLASRARGLFHRAIVQSGGTGTLPPDEGELLADASPAGHHNSSGEVLLRLLRADGNAGSRADAKRALEAMAPADVEAYLRAKPPAALLAAYRTEEQERLIEVPQLFRDGVVLPAAEPLERIAAGEVNRVPTIFGTNRDENKLFLAFNPEYVYRLFWLFPRIRDSRRYEATARHLSAMWQVTGADQPAALLAPHEPSIWLYRFDWDEEPKVPLVDVAKLLGAAHGFEIPFVFGHWFLGPQSHLFFVDENEPGRRELSAKMMSYWAEFARSGDPGRGRDGALPAWEKLGPAKGDRIVFDTAAGGGVRMEAGMLGLDDVIAAVDRDPELADTAAKCDVYRRLVEWNRGIPRERYPRLGERGCAEHPLPAPEIR